MVAEPFETRRGRSPSETGIGPAAGVAPGRRRYRPRVGRWRADRGPAVDRAGWSVMLPAFESVADAVTSLTRFLFGGPMDRLAGKARRRPEAVTVDEFGRLLDAVDAVYVEDESSASVDRDDVAPAVSEVVQRNREVAIEYRDRFRSYLGYQEPAMRVLGSQALSTLAEHDYECVVEYVDGMEVLLHDDVPDVRANAAYYFEHLVRNHPEACDAAAFELADLYRDPGAGTRANVVAFFARFCRERSAVAQSIPELEARLRWLASDDEIHVDRRSEAEQTADFVASCRDDPNVGARPTPGGTPSDDADPQSVLEDVPREEWKYDDADSELAHRRAQQRDPSDVAELGDEVELVLKEVDYEADPPTIRGTKNRLNAFVVDAPDDLQRLDKIRGTVVDYGGKNNSLEVSFTERVE